MKITEKLGNFLLCTLLASPVLLVILSAGILFCYSDSALQFLPG